MSSFDNLFGIYITCTWALFVMLSTDVVRLVHQSQTIGPWEMWQLLISRVNILAISCEIAYSWIPKGLADG